MGMPYEMINIGDVFCNSNQMTDNTYTVVNKAGKMIELRCSYQHPKLPETFWTKPSNSIFNMRLYEATESKTHDELEKENAELRKRIEELEEKQSCSG